MVIEETADAPKEVPGRHHLALAELAMLLLEHSAEALADAA